MLFPSTAAIMVLALQASPADRARAEDLARAGRTEEAIALFERLVEVNPADIEAKLWAARLALRLGRTAGAEAGFRSVLRDHPADIDARIGLGIVLTRTGSWQDATHESSGDQSGLLRGTWQRWRRTALQGACAYGIESFEDLTADRLRALGTTTVAAGVRIDLPSLTRVTTTWEHRWRSNKTTIDRLTVSVVHFLP